MKKNMQENLTWVLLIIIGGLFLGVGVMMTINTFDYEGKVETTAIITNIDRDIDMNGEEHYKVYVRYTAEGKQYETLLNGYMAGFKVGKEIKIYYDKNTPNIPGVKALDFMILLFPIIGGVVIIVGINGIVKKIKKNKMEKELRETGNIIEANYIETRINSSYSRNNVHPYNIICEWDDESDGKKYIFKSDDIWFNPEKFIEQKNIIKFPIYIDMNNKGKYFIDLEQIEANVENMVD